MIIDPNVFKRKCIECQKTLNELETLEYGVYCMDCRMKNKKKSV